MIVQELERLRQDMAEMSRLIPNPREVEAARVKEVAGPSGLAARSAASRRRYA
jgi:hypothetical protein